MEDLTHVSDLVAGVVDGHPGGRPGQALPELPGPAQRLVDGGRGRRPAQAGPRGQRRGQPRGRGGRQRRERRRRAVVR